ncbi:hypothetical protein VPNG_06020 [Cytospora leucostoma]|uniref:TIP41-like protein n=1 Tax=Cytospora leucostoma TaxID=1230097 RepID=A0A423XAX2_9PEZI|nr:hypothetical protein VPNG_06020 [Cytospora leucostoma]
MNHVTSPNEPYPSPAKLSQATKTHRQGSFEVSTRKLPISKSGPIDAMSARLGIPVPEMIFGDNLVAVRHAPSGWRLGFTAEEALDRVDKTGANMLQVAHAGEWSSSRERSSAHGIREVVRPFDWSYSTAKKEIPLELLKRRDPILFFDEVVLFESELDDNGISVFSCKVRVMEQRMLLLARLYMRLDDVVVRVRDTRVYVDFEKEEVIREYTAKEDSFANVKRNLVMSGLLPDAVTAALRDANQVAHLVPVVEHQVDSVTLSA